MCSSDDVRSLQNEPYSRAEQQKSDVHTGVPQEEVFTDITVFIEAQ
jgi:hypothetical protein